MTDEHSQLQAEVDRLKHELKGAYRALGEAGEAARRQRERHARLSADRYRMAAALTAVVRADGVPEPVAAQARQALEGADDHE